MFLSYNNPKDVFVEPDLEMTKDNLLIYLKNKSLNQGSKAIELNGYVYRIVKSDDILYPITRDIKSNRINLELQDGVIINAEIY